MAGLRGLAHSSSRGCLARTVWATSRALIAGGAEGRASRDLSTGGNRAAWEYFPDLGRRRSCRRDSIRAQKGEEHYCVLWSSTGGQMPAGQGLAQGQVLISSCWGQGPRSWQQSKSPSGCSLSLISGVQGQIPSIFSTRQTLG